MQTPFLFTLFIRKGIIKLPDEVLRTGLLRKPQRTHEKFGWHSVMHGSK